jgi:nucleoside-diphosphate-sugar epimerase
MNKILITGSSGFLGKNLFNFLNNQYDTHGSSRNDVDLNDFTATRSYIEKINPSLVIHCAWNLNRTTYNDFSVQYQNYQMTKNLVDICVENNIKIMCIGSSLEYSPGPQIMKETDQTFPVNLYGFAKKECLSYLQEKKYKNYVWIRLFHIFGKNGNNIINETINSLQNNKKIKLSKCEQNIDYIYVKDFLCAVGLILEKDFIGVINICNNSKLSLKKTILEIAEILNKSQELIGFGNASIANSYSYVGDNSVLKSLGYQQQYSFKEAVKDTL